MNSVVIVGRMARDPNVKESQNGNRFVRFSVAVDRPAAPGEPKQSDFPQCIAFGKTAELVGNYCYKGQKVAVEGRIRTGSYKNKNGETVYTTDIVANRVEFLEWRDSQEQNTHDDRFGEPDVPETFENVDEDVPF